MTNTLNRPAYRLLADFYGPDDHLYKEGESIIFDDTPNEEMEPLNESARVKLNTYLEHLDELGRAAAAKAGKAYAGRARSLDGALALATAVQKADMAIMTAKKEVNTIEKFEQEEIPEVGNVNPKRGRGRPAYKNVEKAA